MIQRVLSVSQFVFFKFNGDSNLFQDQIIGKNIFEIGSTYFRIGKSVDTSTPDPDFQEEFPKSGGKFVIVEVEDICVDRIRELELMAVFSSCYKPPHVQAADICLKHTIGRSPSRKPTLFYSYSISYSQGE